MNTTQEPETSTDQDNSRVTTKEIRGSIDNQVSKMDAQATAFEAQLKLEPEQAHERIAEHKQKVEEAGRRVCDMLEQTGSQTEGVVDPLKLCFERLQVQLALGWAEGRDAYAEQKQKIQSSIADFEIELDRTASKADQQTVQTLDEIKRAFIAEADTLEAELNALEIQYVEEKDKLQAEWEQKKQAVESQISQFRDELETKGQLARDKLEAFDNELSTGFSQVKDAFTNLFKK